MKEPIAIQQIMIFNATVLAMVVSLVAMSATPSLQNFSTPLLAYCGNNLGYDQHGGIHVEGK
jgi:hypothetical protein